MRRLRTEPREPRSAGLSVSSEAETPAPARERALQKLQKRTMEQGQKTPSKRSDGRTDVRTTRVLSRPGRGAEPRPEEGGALPPPVATDVPILALRIRAAFGDSRTHLRTDVVHRTSTGPEPVAVSDNRRPSRRAREKEFSSSHRRVRSDRVNFPTIALRPRAGWRSSCLLPVNEEEERRRSTLSLPSERSHE